MIVSPIRVTATVLPSYPMQDSGSREGLCKEIGFSSRYRNESAGRDEWGCMSGPQRDLRRLAHLELSTQEIRIPEVENPGEDDFGESL